MLRLSKKQYFPCIKKQSALGYVCTAILHEDTTKLLLLVEAASDSKLPSMVMR